MKKVSYSTFKINKKDSAFLRLFTRGFLRKPVIIIDIANFIIMWSLELAFKSFYDFFAYDHSKKDTNSARSNSRKSAILIEKKFESIHM